MLRKSFSPIMVNVHGERIQEITFNYIGIYHWLFYFFTYPKGYLRDILTDTSCHMTKRLRKLLPRPHVTITEEKLCTDKTTLFTRCNPTECLLSCHGEKSAIFTLFFCSFNIFFKVFELTVSEKILVCNASYWVVQRIITLIRISEE